MQAIQEVSMAEEWVNDARNEAKVEAYRALGATEQKNKELDNKLVAKERARLSAEARLKNAEDQVKDQCKKLHLTEIELATQRQLVLDLKAELQKAKDAAEWLRKFLRPRRRHPTNMGCRKRR